MPRNAKRYKDVWVSPGCALYNLLNEKVKDQKAIDALYKKCMADYNQMMHREQK